MKRLDLLLAVLLLFLGINVNSARAAEVGGVFLGENEVRQGPLFLAGSQVTLVGTVKGDVYIMGSEVEVTGKVTGDLFCAAQKVTIDGQVDGDIRLLANEAHINSHCPGSVTAVGSQFWLWEEAGVGNGLYLIAQSSHLNGAIDGRLAGRVNRLYINGPVSENTDLRVGEYLALGPKAHLKGALLYHSPKPAHIDKAAVVEGEKEWHKTEAVSRPGINLLDLFISWLGAFVVWWLAKVIQPEIWDNWARELVGKPWRALWLGIMACLLIPAVLFVLVVSIIGLPAAAIVALLTAVIGYLGRIVVAVGFSFFWESSAGKPLAVLAALIPVTIVVYLPRIGMFFTLTYACLGIGSIISMARSRKDKASINTLI